MKTILPRFSLWNRLRRLSGVDCYTFDAARIIRHRGIRAPETIELAAIESWAVEYEMCFDLVHIETTDRRRFVWLDYQSDLLSILRRELRDREVELD